MAVLRVIERLWTRDKIQRQAIDISDAGGRVLDALQNFLAEFDQVGRKLNEANTSFVNARNKLSESTHAVIPRARRLVELGVKGKKALSAELAPDEQVLPLTLERSGSGD
jgi:DNA recombination protein RmuC